MAKNEEWKVIEGYENYSLSNYGGYRNDLTGQTLKYDPNEKGYLRVVLRKEGKRQRVSVHRLVMKMFGTQKITITKDIQVHHIDGNKYNNHISNLAYITDIEHKRLEGKLVLDEEKVRMIMDYKDLGFKASDIAKIMNINYSTLKHVVYGETWGHITGFAKKGRGEATGNQ